MASTELVELQPEVASPPTRPIESIEVGDLADRTGSLRSRTRFTHEDAAELHRDVLFTEWQQLTSTRGKLAPAAMLEQIAELGFSWRDVARLLKVSVPAVQKWRRGEGVTGPNRLNIASLLAMCQMLAEHYAVQEVASWFEMPLTSKCPVTPMDLYATERQDLIFDYASSHADVEQVLNDYDPDWRERYASTFEVYEAADGDLAIRPKE
ncbi:helix-turn-helix transcriptional regulator [Streptomyces alboniger]|uniref:Uncharacterized protein n=1 Tax=Streptomyces alboniger TaxID=132473 RepID=A0A5J6HKV3_STRAD|nr:helix-turn-helix transcriptional regulator [Streptomyces alboniger]QEV18990.1 hypothetical protein CP975_17215 [Streptomyces alboniger]